MNLPEPEYVSTLMRLAMGGTLLFGLTFFMVVQLLEQLRPVPAEQEVTEPYLEAEEVVVIPPEEGESEPELLPIEEVQFTYVRVTDGCGPHYEGDCLNVRSGPGTDYEAVTKLRNNIVLKISGAVERAGETWYKVVFDEWLRYPERVEGDWYVAASYVEVLEHEGDRTTWEHGIPTSTKKWIMVDRGEQQLFAYEDHEVIMAVPISTGLNLTPTPRGTFTIFKKTPSRYMQGPIDDVPGSDYYDLPGVPWNLYFTAEGAVIHGAYWHDRFGSPYSHGCVNLDPVVARELYAWAELGTPVVVQD